MNDRYFRRRNPSASLSFEGGYWGVVRDPDGVLRDRRLERDLFLEDAAEELTFLRRLPPGRILDVGCGLGFLLSALEDGWDRYGIEVSKFAAGHAKKWGSIHLGDLKRAGYPDEFFDVVVLYHVIEHMPHPVSVIREVYRVLKAGGILLFSTPDFDSGCARRFKERYRLLNDQTHISLFSADSAHRFLRDHGFVIDCIEFPFFETRHFTPGNLERLFDTSQISPPFYGNFMTFYAHKPVCKNTVSILQTLGMCGCDELKCTEEQVKEIVDSMVKLMESGHTVRLSCEPAFNLSPSAAREMLKHTLQESKIHIASIKEESSKRSCTEFTLRLKDSSDISETEEIINFFLTSESEVRDHLLSSQIKSVLQIPVPMHVCWDMAGILVLNGLCSDVSWHLEKKYNKMA